MEPLTMENFDRIALDNRQFSGLIARSPVLYAVESIARREEWSEIHALRAMVAAQAIENARLEHELIRRVREERPADIVVDGTRMTYVGP